MKAPIYILTFLLFALFSQETKACTCVGESTIKDEIHKRDAVFVGTIIEKEEIRIYDTLSPNNVIFRVDMKYTVVIETKFKGQQFGDTAFVFTGVGGGDCGFNFRVGQKYLVYADHLKTGDRYNGPLYIDKKSAFRTSICTRTKPYNKSEERQILKTQKREKKN
jgi:hypothetical protein